MFNTGVLVDRKFVMCLIAVQFKPFKTVQSLSRVWNIDEDF